MKNFFSKIKDYIVNHKKTSIFVLIIVLIFGYWLYGKMTSTTGETRYITIKAALGTIISSVSGSGQISASNQINIQPEVSGSITTINVGPGDYVSSGKVLYVIDDTAAQKSVRDAEINLQNANLSLEKLKLQNSEDNLNADLSKTYDDGFNSVSNTFLDLPTIMTGLNNMFYTSTQSGKMYINTYAESVGPADKDKALTYRDMVTNSYNLAKTAYDSTFEKYKNTSRNSSNQDIEDLITQTYNTTKLISDTIKNSNNYIDFTNDSMQRYNFNIPSYIATHKTMLSSYTSQANSHLLDLLSIKTTIKNNKDAFQNSDLDIQSSSLSVKQKENALADAKDNLSKYKILAPFSGIIASVPVNIGDNASGGTILGTIITSKKLATISLNEVDIAKIKLGQKVTLTFDAIPGLTITGRVEEIDSIGTVSQGVVNYNVKISFDTSNVEIKPGMSVNASIITGVKQNVLTVPNSAVKAKGTTTYVETFTTELPAPITGTQGSPSLIPPIQQNVEVGVSNDTSTEIISGLKEGDIIVTKTIASTTTTTSAPSIFSAATGNKGANAGGATRTLRGN